MYRPHHAREDTVVFPAFSAIVPAKEYQRLGDEFEDRERQRLGAGGFQRVLREVMDMETLLAINDLGKFTPTASAMPPEISPERLRSMA
jgi:hypothetical protein